MSAIQFPGRRKSASRAILSVVALIGFLLVASSSSLSDGARIALTVAGYVAFIFFFSLAVQSWRRGS